MNIDIHPWHEDYPEEDGEFFFTGMTPAHTTVVAIVHIYTHPVNGKRFASLFIPPGWRKDKSRKLPEVIFGELHEWKGEWAGPEYGLCSVEL